MSLWGLDSDDEDDTAELLAELERIKKERAEEKLRKVVVFRPFINLQLSSFDGRIEQRVSTLCRFVPLRGGEGWR